MYFISTFQFVENCKKLLNKNASPFIVYYQYKFYNDLETITNQH